MRIRYCSQSHGYVDWLSWSWLCLLVSPQWAVGQVGGSAELNWALSSLQSRLIVGYSSPYILHIPPMCQPRHVLMAKSRSGKKKRRAFEVVLGWVFFSPRLGTHFCVPKLVKIQSRFKVRGYHIMESKGEFQDRL